MIATISRWISLVGGITFLFFGTLGGIFNIFIFAHRTLRSCSCSWYMLMAAIFDLITLDHALLLRILSNGFGIDLISIDNAYCKLRFYTGQIASFAPITLICLAAIDRWAVSKYLYLKNNFNILIFPVNMSICTHTSMEFYSCSSLFNSNNYTFLVSFINS